MGRSRALLFFLCAFVAALLAQLAPSLADKRVALVIGNSNYKHTPALTNPANDATDVAQALTAIGFDVTLKLDVEKRQMDQVVAQFARAATSADAALFYYAGHGMQFQGRNFLMPVDAELQDEISLRYEMTGIDDIKAALERSQGVKIMVLDSCRNNPLAEKLVRSITVSTRDIPQVQGYARPEKTRGMIIVYATQADDVANDGLGRNSPFSAAFLKEIREPGLEVGVMFRRIGGDVYQATNGRQSPELSISMVPEYYLNQAETDQSIWARIRVNADAAAIQEFLQRYPNSFYAPDARARLDLLERQAREKAEAEAEAQRRRASAAEAARLEEEQAARERAAAEARAHEQDLAAKLAAAEAERQKLAVELAQRESAQAAAEARSRAQLDQAEKEREQREASLRAEIEKEKATASQLEKDRLLRDALDKDRAKQAADDQVADERNRVSKQDAERALQAEADRAQALKADIAQLEQQAAQAKANALAEAQKAEDAKKAASAAASELSADQLALVTPIRSELRRVGCFSGGEGNWNSTEMRLDVARYARYAKLAAPPEAPDAALLEGLKGQRERVCPPECSAREVVEDGRCVAKACARGEILARNGACVARPAAPRVAAAREAVKAPVAAKGHCFSFNGNQYCE
jgi:uncharacterized caspase-like protein